MNHCGALTLWRLTLVWQVFKAKSSSALSLQCFFCSRYCYSSHAACIESRTLPLHCSLQVSTREQQSLKDLHSTLTSRFKEYAMQWCGVMLWPEDNATVKPTSRTWSWIFSFNGMEDAMRFVLGTQFGLRSENWQDDFFNWVPESVFSADGQVVFRGPRVTMIVHSLAELRTGAKTDSRETSLLLKRQQSDTSCSQPTVLDQLQSQRGSCGSGMIMAVRSKSTLGCDLHMEVQCIPKSSFNCLKLAAEL